MQLQRLAGVPAGDMVSPDNHSLGRGVWSSTVQFLTATFLFLFNSFHRCGRRGRSFPPPQFRRDWADGSKHSYATIILVLLTAELSLCASQRTDIGATPIPP